MNLSDNCHIFETVNFDESKSTKQNAIILRLKSAIRLSSLRNDIAMRGRDYEAFKCTPQVKGIVPFAYCDMLTDGAGNVISMPLRVPDCFGDVVTIRRWNKISSIATKRSKRKPWLQISIPARCTSCKATQGCSSLGRERIASNPHAKKAFQQWEKLEARLGKGRFGSAWDVFVETVAGGWNWTTMEAERSAHAEKLRVNADNVRRARDRERKASQRAATRHEAAPVPLALDPALEAKRAVYENALLDQITIRPAPPKWRKMTPADAKRITAVWLVRELLSKSIGHKPSAGKVAQMLDMVTEVEKTGEALRARVQADLRLISSLETPPGCWS